MTPLLDQISLTLAYSATAVYACAFVAYTLAFSRSATVVVPTRSLVVVGGTGTPAATGSQPRDDGGQRPGRRASRSGFALTCIALAIEVAAAAIRGVAAARVPWAYMFVFSLTGTILLIAVFLVVIHRTRFVFLGSFVLGLVTILLGVATVGFYVPVVPLPPALQSAWLVIHVLVALLATAFFGITFTLSGAQLIALRQEHGRRLPGRIARLLRAIPDAETLDTLVYRLTIVGFTLWTFTLMAGAIWAGRAWGRYWGWDTKEVWTFVIWVIYAAYLHAKATRGWNGARAAWLSIIGFATVAFNFGIVNVFFSGLHSYSGLK